MPRPKIVEGIPEALGSLTKLQYLNLSHCHCIDGTKMTAAMAGLTEVRHLYLSGFLDSTSHLDESTVSTFMECISNLSNLEHLDLSDNFRLRSLPDCFGCLRKLRVLDLSNCRALQFVPQSVAQIDGLQMVHMDGCDFVATFFWREMNKSNKSLVTLPEFQVHADHGASSSNFALLQGVNPVELKIGRLEKVKSIEEVESIRLVGKERIKELGFEWSRGSMERAVEDKIVALFIRLIIRLFQLVFSAETVFFSHKKSAETVFQPAYQHSRSQIVLGGLVPPSAIESLHIRGYNSTVLPGWLMGIPAYNFPNLVKIYLVSLDNCISLPPLGQLPNLEELVLEAMQSIAKIDEDLCGGAVAFPRLKRFTLGEMQSLQVWNTMYSGYMFPCLCTLMIRDCPKLRLKPCPPNANYLIIRDSDGVLSSWGESTSSDSTSSSPRVNILRIEGSKVPMHQWRLIHHLPALRDLHIMECSDLTSSPEITRALSPLNCLSVDTCNLEQLPEWLGHLTSLEKLELENSEVEALQLQEVAKHLTSLQKLYLTDCDSMIALPQWVGDLASLQELKLAGCPNLNNLQEIKGCLTSLEKLYILNCDDLESLPESIQQSTKLKHLGISGCPALRRWCETENKRKLSHIKTIDMTD